MEQTFLSATILLVLVADPVGNIPLFIGALRRVEGPNRRLRIIVRECAIAFIVLLLFMFFGRQFMVALQLTGTSLQIAGGVVLILIALRMIFPSANGIFGDSGSREPFIVPLAVPALAGPSALATVLLLASQHPARLPEWIGALSIAMLVSALVLAFAERIQRFVGEQAVMAFERLMGLILSAIAIEMLLKGIEAFVRQLR
jgi:MarC family membrane protein